LGHYTLPTDFTFIYGKSFCHICRKSLVTKHWNKICRPVPYSPFSNAVRALSHGTVPETKVLTGNGYGTTGEITPPTGFPVKIRKLSPRKAMGSRGKSSREGKTGAIIEAVGKIGGEMVPFAKRGPHGKTAPKRGRGGKNICGPS